MKIAIGCAKVAYPLKESVRKHVEEMGHEVIDFCPDPEAAMHYAEVAAETAEGMLREKCDRGILLCGTGMGRHAGGEYVQRDHGRSLRKQVCGKARTVYQ